MVSLRSTTGSWMKPLRGVFLRRVTRYGWQTRTQRVRSCIRRWLSAATPPTPPAGHRNHRRCCGLRFAGGVAALNHRHMDETPSGCFLHRVTRYGWQPRTQRVRPCLRRWLSAATPPTPPAGHRNHRRCCGLRFVGGVAALNHRLMDETPSGCSFAPHGTLRVAENEPSGFVLALGGG